MRAGCANAIVVGMPASNLFLFQDSNHGFDRWSET